VKEIILAMETELLKFMMAPAEIAELLLTVTAPENVTELLSVRLPFMATGPPIVKEAVPPTFEVLLKVTAPVPVLLKVPAFEMPPAKT
jgi:hypothetical protein